jgi:hypothetical protein
MVMMWPWQLAPKVRPQRSKRLPMIKLVLGALNRTPKLMRTLKGLRCEGVEFSAELFCKIYFGPHLRIHTFCDVK